LNESVLAFKATSKNSPYGAIMTASPPLPITHTWQQQDQAAHHVRPSSGTGRICYFADKIMQQHALAAYQRGYCALSGGFLCIGFSHLSRQRLHDKGRKSRENPPP
jgi:hypothetical protein